MLENNPAGLKRAEIERIVGHQYSSFVRQQHDSKTLSASGGITTADRGEKKRRPRNRFKGNRFNCRRKGCRAEDCRTWSAKEKMEKSGDAPTVKKGGCRQKCYVCGSEEHFARKHCGSCRSLEPRDEFTCRIVNTRRSWPRYTFVTLQGTGLILPCLVKLRPRMVSNSVC